MNRRGFLVGGAASLAAAAAACQAPSYRKKTGTPREVQSIVRAQASRDGAGVSLRRSLGSRLLPMLDPFLLLDEMHSSEPSDYVAGFPRHPHRGFETVSYVLRGGFEHRDSVGNHGLIADGGVQWMTAGRGIVHEEMPRATSSTNELWGLQLWVNLPAKQKWIAPRYQDLEPSAVPEIAIADGRARVVAGTIGATTGPVDGIVTQPTMLDIALEAGATFEHALPGGDNAFVYALEGEVVVGSRGESIAAGQLAVATAGTSLVVTTQNGGRFLLLSGTPIAEPVARRGPFVMTTDAELDQAFEDYRTGRLTG